MEKMTDQEREQVAAIVAATDWPEYAAADCLRLGFDLEACVRMADAQKAAVLHRAAVEAAARGEVDDEESDDEGGDT